MPNKEKVIKGLECHKYTNCKVCIFKSGIECPYFHDEDCRKAVFDDAISILKEQEAKSPVICEKNGYWDYVCPTCGSRDEELFREWNYCPFCGQAVKWE